MNKDYQATLAIAEQAAEWLERLPTADVSGSAAFLRWFRQSPVHAREFFLAVRTAERLKHLDSQRLLDVHAFVAQTTQDVAQLITPSTSQAVPHGSAPRPRRVASRWTLAAAACFLAVLMIVTVTLRGAFGNSITTAAGESRTVYLADGSILRAGPRTLANVAFTEHDRRVHLLRGEVMVQVAKDSARPFYLQTELATTRAVGTAFAVRRFERDSVVVTVRNGKVAVARGWDFDNDSRDPSAGPTIVSAGEQVRVTMDSAGPLQVRQINLGKELAWVDGKLMFTTETIGDAVQEFNLRNNTQIRVLSSETEHRAVRGIFQATDPRAFALSVAASAHLTLREDASGTLLLLPRLGADARDLSGPRSR